MGCSIGKILIPAMIQFPEQEDHQEIKKEDSDPVIEDPSFSTECEVGKLSSNPTIEVRSANVIVSVIRGEGGVTPARQ